MPIDALDGGAVPGGFLTYGLADGRAHLCGDIGETATDITV
ncbi:hypothetical protein [Nocardia sp. BMG111209]|nr:hypothetical protein [Nocardia sp. BMG111209]